MRTQLEDFKVIDETTFAVDEFHCPGAPDVTHWFLSHFHGDHYGGLSGGWKGGQIYTGEMTAALVKLVLGVPEEFLVPLPFDTKIPLKAPEQSFVTLRDAFHCPGAAVFVFDLPPSRKKHADPRRRYIIHTGDFRFNEEIMGPWIHELRSQSQTHYIDILYLDTTYCSPAHNFPLQRDVVQRVRDFAAKLVASDADAEDESSHKKTGFMICTYNIGKEKIVDAICDVLSCDARISENKAVRARLMKMLTRASTELTEATRVFVLDWATLRIPNYGPVNNWVSMQNAMNDINEQLKAKYPGAVPFDRMCAVIPTGWCWSGQFKKNWAANSEISLTLTNLAGNLLAIRVPYSEHSSYPELFKCVELVRPRHVISTVGRKDSRSRSEKMFTKYLDVAAVHKEAVARLFSGAAEEWTVKLVKSEDGTESGCKSTFDVQQIDDSDEELVGGLVEVKSEGLRVKRDRSGEEESGCSFVRGKSPKVAVNRGLASPSAKGSEKKQSVLEDWFVSKL